MIEERILKIEEYLDNNYNNTVPGTSLNRIINSEEEIVWCLGIGFFMQPLIFFESNTIESCISKAEKKKAEAEGDASALVSMAKAEAEANKLKQQSITDNIIKMEWIRKWDGKLPEVTSDLNMIISLE